MRAMRRPASSRAQGQLAKLRQEIDRGLATAKRSARVPSRGVFARVAARTASRRAAGRAGRRGSAAAGPGDGDAVEPRHPWLRAEGGGEEDDACRVADRLEARGLVSRRGVVPRAGEQVSAHHQRRRHQDRRSHEPERWVDGDRRVHRHDVRAAQRGGDRSRQRQAGQAWRAPRRGSRSDADAHLVTHVHRSLVGRDARARAGGAARGASAQPLRQLLPQVPQTVAGEGAKAPPSHRASPTAPKAGAIRSSACCVAGWTRAPTPARGPRVSAASASAEVSLRGTVASQGAFVGIVQGVDSKNYIVRVGDKLLRRHHPNNHSGLDGDPAAGQRSALAGETARSAEAAPTDGRGQVTMYRYSMLLGLCLAMAAGVMAPIGAAGARTDAAMLKTDRLASGRPHRGYCHRGVHSGAVCGIAAGCPHLRRRAARREHGRFRGRLHRRPASPVCVGEGGEHAVVRRQRAWRACVSRSISRCVHGCAARATSSTWKPIAWTRRRASRRA